MIKFIKFYLLLSLTVLFVLIAQLVWIQYLPVYGIGPQILLVSVIYFSLCCGPKFGEIFGFICGIFLDTFSVSVFGTQAFVLTLIGYICGRLSGRIDEGSMGVQFLFSLVGTCLQIGIMYLVSVIFVSYSLVGYKDIIITPAYTAVLAPVLFKILNLWMEIVRKWSGRKSRS